MKRLASGSPLLIAMVAILSNQGTEAAPVSFQQAVADYTAGRYSQANAEFETYKQAYPTNAMVHYYLALCKQALGHIEGAKAEYLWVTQNGDARLRGMAQSGFDQLSKAKYSGTSTSVATATPGHTTGTSATSSTPVVATAKVKKIIEFYADW